jgi:hypothetical protein
VTQLAIDGVASLKLQSLLRSDCYRLPLPGKWWWTIQIGDPKDRLRLLDSYTKIILRCESAGAARRPPQMSSGRKAVVSFGDVCLPLSSSVRFTSSDSAVNSR